MIKQVNVINYKGEKLEMVLKSPEKSGLNITDISGIGAENANVFINDSLNTDGGVYTGSRKSVRNIVFSIEFMFFPSVEENRRKTYKYFPLKKEIKIEFITDDRCIYIYGRVESNVPNIFSQKESCQISILCPDPNFYLLSDSIESFKFDGLLIHTMFELPVIENPFIFAEIESDAQYKQVNNYGDLESPTLITIKNLICTPGDTTTWYNKPISIKNITTDKEFKITFTNITIVASEEIIISSYKNAKTVLIYNPSTNIYRNGINYINQDSEWLFLDPGINFLYSNYPDSIISEQNDNLIISFPIIYEGV